MKAYKVVAKCGHVGKKHYVLKTFPIRAQDGREAARICRNLPRVKHHHKDAIISVEEVSLTEFFFLVKQNQNDPYFSCKNIQDQRRYDETVYFEPFREIRLYEKSRKSIYHGKEILRYPKKYMRNIYFTERYAI